MIQLEAEQKALAWRFFAEGILRRPSLPVTVSLRPLGGADLVWISGDLSESVGLILNSDARYHPTIWRSTDWGEMAWVEHSISAEVERRFWIYLGAISV